jgi:NADPH-dependent 2,4-dienoyl-CoA reductase/sulfur reductase-like enzyme/rhodanese-related sulfurtransferase
MSRRTIVVLGGVMGGAAAAKRARETDEDARIVLLEPSAEVNYAMAGLAYSISGEVVSLEALNRQRAAYFHDIYRVEARTGVAPRRLDAASCVVVLDDERLQYTSLVYALAPESVLPPVPDLLPAANVLQFRILSDFESIAGALVAGARRAAVLGGGMAAVEAADAFARRGLEVVLVESQARLLMNFSETSARLAREALEKAGVRVHTGTAPARALRDGDRVRALELGREALEVDLVVVAGALQPKTELLREAGAELHEDGSVLVDEHGATSLPHVWAGGGSVAVTHAVSCWPIWLPRPAIADKTAQVAGTCAAGGTARMVPVVNTVIVRAGDLTLGRTGLSWEEAAAFAGREVGAVSIHGSSCDRYLAPSQPLSVTLTYHKADGRILGAEVAGRAGVDKRVDVLSTAIAGGLTVETLSLLDLAYAPPYATARDAIHLAGHAAAAARAGLARPWLAEELSAGMAGVHVVEVEPERGRAGEMDDALEVPFRQLRDRLASLPRDKPIVFVSETGRLGYLAARLARQRGFKDAGYLVGGLLSWRAAGRRLGEESRHR